MSIEVECPDCFRPYRVADERAGRRMQCRECGATVPIPRPQASRRSSRPIPPRVPRQRQQNTKRRRPAASSFPWWEIAKYSGLVVFVIGAIVYCVVQLNLQNEDRTTQFGLGGLFLFLSGLWISIGLGTDREEMDPAMGLMYGEEMLYRAFRRPGRSWPGYLAMVAGGGLFFMAWSTERVQARSQQQTVQASAAGQNSPRGETGQQRPAPAPLQPAVAREDTRPDEPPSAVEPAPAELPLPENLLEELAAVADPRHWQFIDGRLVALGTATRNLEVPLTFPNDYSLRLVISRDRKPTSAQSLHLFFPAGGAPCLMRIPHSKQRPASEGWIGPRGHRNRQSQTGHKGQVMTLHDWSSTDDFRIRLDVHGTSFSANVGAGWAGGFRAPAPASRSVPGADRLRLVLQGAGWTIREASISPLPPAETAPPQRSVPNRLF